MILLSRSRPKCRQKIVKNLLALRGKEPICPERQVNIVLTDDELFYTTYSSIQNAHVLPYA